MNNLATFQKREETIHDLPVNELPHKCDPKTVNCKSTAEIGPQDTIIGQEQAVRALRFGLGIQDRGFNIFVAGMLATGRTTTVKQFLEEIASSKPVPMDWCYVHNFEESYHPHAFRLPAGRNADGSFAPEGLFAKVNQKLAKMAEELVKFRGIK